MENILFIADLTDSITRVVFCQITNGVCPGFCGFRQINKDVDEAIEGMMAEAFKDGSVYEAASSVFSDDYCEAIR